MLAVVSQSCPRCSRTFTAGELYCPFDRTPLGPEPPAADPMIGSVVADSYTVVERLGSGGMGVVYKALQHRLHRAVALKVLPPQVGADDLARQRFRREALAASLLGSPHTVTIHDFGTTETGALYIAMHLLEGESLRERLRRGALPMRTAVSIAAQVCEALAEAHERQPQILHRDIKPDNVFVRDTADGEPFATVLDFGLARFAGDQRVTSTSVVVGTPAYLAPEMYTAGREADVRVDLYAVGVVLFEMLAGEPPFTADDTAAIMYKHLHDAPARLSGVPMSLEALVAELLTKDPERRPASAFDVRTRLLRILRESSPALTAHDAPTQEAIRGVPVRVTGSLRWWLWPAVAGLVAIAAAWGVRAERRARQEAFLRAPRQVSALVAAPSKVSIPVAPAAPTPAAPPAPITVPAPQASAAAPTSSPRGSRQSAKPQAHPSQAPSAAELHELDMP